MRVITVPVVKNKESEMVLSVALELAKTLQANVQGYHLLPGKRGIFRPDNLFTRLTSDGNQQELSSKELQELCDDAEQVFTELVEKHEFELRSKIKFQEQGGLASWNKFKGGTEQFFSIIGPVSDLIVISRPNKQSSILAKSFLLSAILRARRPVLVLPKRKKPKSLGQRVLLAWNQSDEAIESIVAALPILQAAESVQVISAGKEDELGPNLKHLQRYLSAWGITVSVTKTKGDAEQQEILDTYHKTESDLLVMGAYSRNHWREKVLGGMTDHVVNQTQIPTLLLHR